MDVVACECGEEVGEDSQDDGCAAEFDEVEEEREPFEGETTTFSHVFDVLVVFMLQALEFDEW